MPPRRAAVLAATVLLWVVAALWVYLTLTTYTRPGLFGEDAHAYWVAGRADHPYGAAAGTRDAYLYSPAFLQVVRLPALLPWPAFVTLWCGVEAIAFAWLLKPWGWRWGVPAYGFCLGAVLIGNVFGVLAVTAVLGSRPAARWGSAWAYGLLTKVTPGLVGLAFLFGARRWSALAWAVGATAVVAAISYAVSPGEWADWWHFLRGSHESGALRLRTAAALVIALVAGVIRRPVLVAVALALAAPNLGGAPALAVLAAVPRLLVLQRAWCRDSPDSAA